MEEAEVEAAEAAAVAEEIEKEERAARAAAAKKKKKEGPAGAPAAGDLPPRRAISTATHDRFPRPRSICENSRKLAKAPPSLLHP